MTILKFSALMKLTIRLLSIEALPSQLREAQLQHECQLLGRVLINRVLSELSYRGDTPVLICMEHLIPDLETGEELRTQLLI